MIFMLLEDCDKEATLVVILGVKSHASFKVEWILKGHSSLHIVVVCVVLMKHGLA